MYLLADSGATKTDWIVFDKTGEVERFRTTGMNSMVQSANAIRTGAMEELKAALSDRKIHEVHFYGAGLRTKDKQKVIRSMLEEVLEGAIIHVEHDLLGAARATCGNEPGIACILGTGSNSGWYDGEKVIAELGGNGYLFGDEGSGADLGKTLLKMALDAELPQHIVTLIEEHAGKSLLEIRNDAYRHPRPNNFFAEWARFIKSNIEINTLQGMVVGRLSTFIAMTVMKYIGYQDMTVHFVGSISDVFRYELGQACTYLKINAGRIVRKPIDAMLDYHLAELRG